ncbi:methionyl-tRNA formyltransferase [Pyrus ussuriensis x Pyrus communis]|uniref:Methionyl-tRNA formyltransferase n=1 Tax=Pyrus ussuriensis x Pyrus communis TaxID=2448454 RepID=A0A5N5GNU9_9ROSA|nr:methionyl-tRNA formyltransferase [Pyrus ussuriensis x Pyrus communis]
MVNKGAINHHAAEAQYDEVEPVEPLLHVGDEASSDNAHFDIRDGIGLATEAGRKIIGVVGGCIALTHWIRFEWSRL